MIASFRLLSIIHIAVGMPHRWFTDNAHTLAAENFGMLDMAEVAQLIHDALEKNALDGKLVLEQEYMIRILKPIKEKVPTFSKYLTFMLEEYQCFSVGL